jgi:hypothetical protein
MAVLTPAGRERLGPATSALNRVFADLGLSDEELDRLIALLNELRRVEGDPVPERAGTG